MDNGFDRAQRAYDLAMPPEYDEEEDDRDDDFADPGGRSALRAGPRVFPCPNCEQPNRLSAADVARGYQCDACADHAEGIGPDGNGDY